MKFAVTIRVPDGRNTIDFVTRLEKVLNDIGAELKTVDVIEHIYNTDGLEKPIVL